MPGTVGRDYLREGASIAPFATWLFTAPCKIVGAFRLVATRLAASCSGRDGRTIGQTVIEWDLAGTACLTANGVASHALDSARPSLAEIGRVAAGTAARTC